MIRGFFRRCWSSSTHQKDVIKSTERVSSAVLDLIKDVDLLNITDDDETTIEPTVRYDTSYERRLTPFYIQKRYFHTSPILRADTHHLDAHGRIKEKYINKRLKLLDEQKLLQDVIEVEGRKIYQNEHLYNPDDTDYEGNTNLERMKRGNCPLCPDGGFIVIHHLDQRHAGDWVILTNNFHQYYDLALHSQVSLEEGVQRDEFNKEKKAYWKSVAQRIEHERELEQPEAYYDDERLRAKYKA